MAKINLNDIDLTKVEAKPIIRDSVIEVVCSAIELKKNKDNTCDLMNLTFKTLAEYTNTKGNPIPAGHVMFHTVTVSPVGKLTEDMIARNLVDLQLGFNGEKTSQFDTDDIMGKTAKAKLSIENSTEYGEQNRIKGFIPKEG